MNENIDFIILEHDEGAGCALIAGAVDGVVPAIDGYNTPYVVAKGYDHATREWEDCTLFDDIGKAKLAYERLRRREYSLRSDFYPDFYPERLVEIAEADVALHGSPIPRVLIPRDCPAFKLGDSVDAWDAGKIGDEPITVRDLEDIGTREVHVDNFAEKPEEVRFFLRTDADVYLFGSSLGKSLEVEDRAGEDIAPALREVRTYCKDATEKRDPQLICAKAQAAAAKSATAEGEAGGKKL